MKYRLNRKFIPWLVLHSIEYWYYYLGALFCLVMLHHFSSEIPMLAKELGDLAIAGKLDEIEIKTFFLLAIYILFFRTLSRLLFFYPARIQQRNLRMELVNRLEVAPPRNYKNYNEGMLFQTLYNDLNRIRGFVGFALLQFGNIIIATYIFVPKIRDFNPDFLVAFTPLIGTVFCFALIVGGFFPFVKRQMDQYADVQNFLLESYEAKKTIQNYHAEKDFYKYFDEVSGKELKTFFISSIGRVISFPLVKLGFGASLIWAALIVKNDNLPASDLIYFSSFLFLILEPLMFVSWIGIVTTQGYAAWVRIKSLVRDLSAPLTADWLVNQSGLESVRMPLWDHEIEVEFPKNQWSVIVGETGSGKSWLIENYAQYLQVKGKRYSLIHQEPYIYNDTILDNIFLGQEVTLEKLKLAKEYLHKFGLDILAKNMDDLLSLELGENGKRVSGGQAKRIALIRSLVADVDFVLWDDPFSSVDLILEAKILDDLQKEASLKNRTFVLTSHRLSTVRACDHITYISKSQGIIEKGKIEIILNQKSRVDEFFNKQMA
ncbi:MAG: hypothetical protein CME62_09480 [Halobacteriovoraceae bacterium]|nr:hypothetical protein [Halobacteriovoraceae bacterium]|tara:strand:+ start:2575 stop:4212 length:1638 start_codon:yes stop_codon:yes gene_type:complete